MQIKVFPSNEQLSAYAAQLFYDIIKAKPNAVICCASGNSPLLFCKKFVELAQNESIDLSNITLLGLDEWIGIPPENEGSCAYFLNENLIKPLGLRADQVHLFDHNMISAQNDCKKVDEYLLQVGGLDAILVGIGLNGHIGFNEPGLSFDLPCHIAELADITKQVGQKYFQTETKLSHGVTVGLRHLLQAKCAVLVANGESKAQIIKKLANSKPDESLPATVMKMHKNGYLLLDEAAAAKIQV